MNAKANRKPWPYQEDCLKNLWEAREAGKTKALVVMASGTGKTLTSIFDLKEYLKESPEGRVLVLCHSADILRQTKEEYRVMFGCEYSYGMYNESEKATRRTDFLFANLQSVSAHLDEFGAEDFAYIIMDEAHHAPAATYRRAVEHFAPKFLLGLTATPKRTDDADILQIFGEQVFTYTMEEAINDGWLSGIDYRLELDELEGLLSFLNSDEPVSMTRLNRELFIPKRDEKIVEIIRERSAELENPTMVIFCQDIPSAEHFAELMGDAIVVHSKLSTKTNVQRLADFRSGKVRTICAVNKLNEGIDIPRTDVVVFLRATQSKIIFTQQMGRGLRLAEGKDKVIVLDFVATADRLVEIFELERKFKETPPRYPRKNGESVRFTLNIDTPEFKERMVDIVELIRKAQEYVSPNTRTYTNEELLELLRTKARELGRTPTMYDMKDDPNMPSINTYLEHFGSFVKALLLAGLQPNRWQGLSNDDMLTLLKIKAHELGKTPTGRDVDDDPSMPSAMLYHKRFGSFQRALELAGLKPSMRFWKNVSNAELLELLVKKANELGRVPTKKDLGDDPDMPSVNTYAHRFGSYTKALELAGLTSFHRKCRWTNEEMLELLAKKAEELGRTPTMKDVDDDPNMPSSRTYADRFGSFLEALELAGLKTTKRNCRRNWTNEEMLELLAKKAEELGRTPTQKDVDSDPNMPSATLYAHRFGSFLEALELAGLQPDAVQRQASRAGRQQSSDKKKCSSKKGGKKASG